MIKNVDLWLWSYLKPLFTPTRATFRNSETVHILFTICDHYEPYWNNVDDTTAYNRVKKWIDNYQLIAANHKDSTGGHPKHCFFYPAEEYRSNLIDMVSEICHNGFGETEIHLHHDNDTSENLRITLNDFKRTLSEVHGLLPVNKHTNNTQYGFIHGNWALDNSRPDGKCCGVNDEISILKETGCYADFTMPSAPSDTQTKTINSIYYAIDDPNKPKSHDSGTPATAGKQNQQGLLCIQGPLCLNPKYRKFRIIPRIENGCLASDIPMTIERVRLWIKQHIHVQNRPDVVFVKLYCHGTQEMNMDFFFKQGALDRLYTQLEEHCKINNHSLYYVSARQMYNVVRGLEAIPKSKIEALLDFELKLKY